MAAVDETEDRQGCFVASGNVAAADGLFERQNQAGERSGRLFWTRVIILSSK